MIRKQKTFLNSNVRNAIPVCYTHVRQLADSLSNLAAYFSLWPERSSVDVTNRLKAVLDPMKYDGGQGEYGQYLPGFASSSKRAERTEVTIRVLPDDMTRFVKAPMLLHMNFFTKNGRSPFYEIEFKIHGEAIRAEIYESHVVDHWEDEMRAEAASIQPFRPKE